MNEHGLAVAWTVDIFENGRPEWTEGQRVFETLNEAKIAKQVSLSLPFVLAARIVFIGSGAMPQGEK